MPEANKCPSCDGEVVEGILLDQDRYLRQAKWHDGIPETGFFGLKVNDWKVHPVSGYRCKKCGLLQLFAN